MGNRYRLPLFVTGALLCSTATAVNINLQVNPSGSYSVGIDGGAPWLTSDVYAIHSNNQLLTSTNNGLTMDNPPTSTNGQGPFGPYTGYSISWNKGIFITNFYVYNNLNNGANGAIVFEQVFPQGLTGTAVGTSSSDSMDLSSSFPTFGPALPKLQTDKGYFAWSDCMSGGHVGSFTATGVDAGHFGANGGVMGLFNKSLTTLVASSLSDYMVSGPAWANSLGQVLGFGFLGQVASIPAGWKHQTVMVAGQGINNTMYAWGNLLLQIGNKQRTAIDADFQTNYLSYWTDNGAYYYYNTENNTNYEQTMLDVKAYWAKLNLPVRSFQFDSWWYFKLPNRGAVTLWEPMPDYFPDTMNPWLGLPLALHNRYFAPVNNYTAMGYQFITEPGAELALPVDENMFTYIMTKAKKWGMTMYEQDWLITVYQGLHITQNNVTAAKTWLHAMGNAAEGLGLTIQYCMPLINHMLESTSIQPVTNARASGDYHPGTDQWAIGLSSLFYYSIGIQPSKDDFWTTEYQPGSPYGDQPTEPNWQLQAIITTLSTGPVGPSDMINGTNATLVMQTCRSGDGLLLRPDKPATTVDSAFTASVWGTNGWTPSFASEHPSPLVTTGDGTLVVGTPSLKDVTVPDVYITHSEHGHGAWYWHYVIATRLGSNYSLDWSDLGSTGQSTSYVAIDWFNPGAGPWGTISPSSSLIIPWGQGQPSAPSNAHNIRYTVLAPIFPGGWILMGEYAKITTMSRQRITNVTTTSDSFSAFVHTSSAETTVVYSVAVPSSLVPSFVKLGYPVDQLTGVMPVTCTTRNGMDVTLSCAGNGCTCA